MTGDIYFAMLNEVEQEQFTHNYYGCRFIDCDIRYYLEEEYLHFDEFISCAFFFNKAPEGREYWETIRDSQRDGVNGRINKDADIKNRLDNIPPELLLLMALTNPDSYKKRTSEEDLQDVLSDLGIKLQEDDKV